MRQIRIHRFLIALLPLTLAACISSSPSARFYTLHADISGVDPGSQALGDDWVGVGPIDVPDYLDRPQIVTRGDGHRLIIHEFDRWADPVKNRILDVVIGNVVALSDSKRVAPYPWPSTFRPSRRMMGEITAFEARPAGDVLLRVRWLISIPGDRENEEIHVGEYVEPAAPGDFDAMAEAMSRALERWSRDIASALSESVANDRE
jgi:uncharacterized lipoprotein YmbA